MVIGALKIRVKIAASGSLKEKRRALRSVKDRLGHMNVSVAEVDDQDKWQASTLGLAAVSNEAAHVNGVMDKVFDRVEGSADLEIIDSHLEIIHL
ncbi:MAG: DUF503 domain-containing protein [Thermodesulfobacteriota bacterium]|nr:DUF503 domain-containing protein [Thermodesulfobacteriota bacterium]